jgi:hypothetical protein
VRRICIRHLPDLVQFDSGDTSQSTPDQCKRRQGKRQLAGVIPSAGEHWRQWLHYGVAKLALGDFGLNQLADVAQSAVVDRLGQCPAEARQDTVGRTFNEMPDNRNLPGRERWHGDKDPWDCAVIRMARAELR